jgi:hypothetical protein
MWPIVYTRFFNIWAVWPSFWTQVTLIQIWPRNYKKNFQTNAQDILIKTVATRVLTSFIIIFSSCYLVIYPRWSMFELIRALILDKHLDKVWWWLRQNESTWVLMINCGQTTDNLHSMILKAHPELAQVSS